MTSIVGDELLERNVREEFAADPAIDARDITLAALAGIVTLTGTVTNLAQTRAAERAAARTAGCRAVICDLTVALSPYHVRSDSALAAAALHAIAWESTLPIGSVTVRVTGGRLTLEGSVDWPFQVVNAERAVAHLFGLVELVNRVNAM